MKVFFKLAICFALLFYVKTVSSQERHPSSFLITDTDKKLAMGFSENEIIYEIENNNTSDNLADKYQKEALGGTIVRTAYLGVESKGRSSDFQYSTVSGSGDIYRTSSVEMFADILLTLPDGANFNFVRVWGLDTNAIEDMSFFLFERCLPFSSAGSVETTILATVTSNTSVGNFSALMDITQDGVVIDNSTCTYTFRTRFNTTNNTLVLFKVRAQTYVL